MEGAGRFRKCHIGWTFLLAIGRYVNLSVDLLRTHNQDAIFIEVGSPRSHWCDKLFSLR